MYSTAASSKLGAQKKNGVCPNPSPVQKGGVRTLHRMLAEAVLCTLVATVATYCAWSVLHPFSNVVEEQERSEDWVFDPCIQMAAGNGMVSLPEKGLIPELDAFLEGRAAEFDTSLLADSLVEQEQTGSPWVWSHYYLVHSIAITYRLFGINRWSVLILCGILHVVCAATLYGIFRLGMGRVLSFAGGILCASSPAYLSMCWNPRDFGKAPWILMVILVLGVLIRFRHQGKGLLTYAAILGAIMGIGYGFRQDVIICLIPALAVVLVVARVNTARTFAWRVSAAATMVLLFATLAYPVLMSKQQLGASVSSHTLIQGLASENEKRMGFGNGSYEFNLTEYDPYCVGLAQSYAERVGNAPSTILDHTPAYGRAGMRMFLDVFFLCPADQISRGLASIAATPKLLSSSWGVHPSYPNPKSDPLDRFERLHAPVSNMLVRCAFLCTFLGFVFLGMYDLRAALGVAFLFTFFGAYPSLLYVYRHAFHLSFIPYWFTGLSLSFLGGAIRYALMRGRRGNLSEFQWKPNAVRRLGLGLSVVFASAFLALGLLGIILLVQRTNLERMVDRYGVAQLEPLTVEREKKEDGVLLSLPQSICEMQGRPVPSPGETASEYLVVVFRGPRQAISTRIEYDAKELANFSQDVVIPPGDGLRFFFPVIEGCWDGEPSRFRGLRVRGEGAKYITGLYRVSNAEKFRLWPFLMLPAARRDFKWSKKGPIEKALLGMSVELRSGFGWSRQRALDGYLSLANRYPGHLPFTRRAFVLAARRNRFDEVMRVWDTVLCNDLQPGKDAASSLGQLNDIIVFTPTEFDWMQQAFKDRWTPPRRPITLEKQRLLIEHGADLARQGALRAAKTAYRSAMESGDCALAHKALSDLYVEAKDFDGLEEEWRREIRVHPGRALAHLELGLALERQGDLDGAMTAYGRAFVLEPRALGTRVALAEVLRSKAKSLSESGEAEEGKKAYRKIIGLIPQGYGAYDSLSELYVAAGDLRGLEKEWQTAVQRNPDRALAHFSLGLARERQDNLDGAIASYEEALHIDPQAEGTRQALARVLHDKTERLKLNLE